MTSDHESHSALSLSQPIAAADPEDGDALGAGAKMVAADDEGLAAAVAALRAGEVVIIPTDTVYGVAVDPTIPGASDRLFSAKARPRGVPLAVLVATPEQGLALARSPLGDVATRLVRTQWPGPLTLVVDRAPGWSADLGEARRSSAGGPEAGGSSAGGAEAGGAGVAGGVAGAAGGSSAGGVGVAGGAGVAGAQSALAGGDSGETIGVRCPDHAWVRELCRRVGPLATSSANRHGLSPPTTAVEAAAMLGRSVALAVDGGACTGTSSTVVDVTVDPPRLLREGPLSAFDLRLTDRA